MKNIHLSKVFLSFNSASAFAFDGSNTYEGVTWLSEDITMPSKEEFEARWEELEQQYLNNQYQRDRAKEYPSLQEQLDMQYWDSVNGTTTWQDAINAVKAKYPKP